VLEKQSVNLILFLQIHYFSAMTVPDRRCRILEVVLVRCLVTWVLGIWRGEGLEKGFRKGRSVMLNQGSAEKRHGRKGRNANQVVMRIHANYSRQSC
jgi:hypothetical protein